MKKKNLILVLILLIAAGLRLWQLDRVPPSPSLDEVSLGWNAWSILKTGQDEYGARLPILLRAYDDWRPAAYVYLVIPWLRLLGLSVMAVRLPAVILSLITILTSYFLVKELFWGLSRADWLALITSFLLAISPWFIYFSRLGHEVNLGLTVLLLAVLFFLRFIRQQKDIFLFLSVVFFAFCFYTYQSLKIFAPLLVISLLLTYRRPLLKKKKTVFLAGGLGLLLVIPVLILSFSGGGTVRFQGTNLLSSQAEIFAQAAERINRDFQKGYWWGLVFDNRRLAAVGAITRAYLSHFDPRWLFLNQGADKHKIPGLGLFYFWELPLLCLGIYWFLLGRFKRETKFLVLAWWLLASLPAALTTDAPHAMRSFNLLPIPQILVALGVVCLFLKIKAKQKLLAIGLGGLVLVSLAYLVHNYFINFPQEQSQSFQLALAEAIDYVLANEKKYDQIIFSNHDQTAQSYMFFLFFSQYDPELYQRQGGTISAGFEKSHQIGKYQFRHIDWPGDAAPQTLYLGNKADFPTKFSSLQKFVSPQGKLVLMAVEALSEEETEE